MGESGSMNKKNISRWALFIGIILLFLIAWQYKGFLSLDSLKSKQIELEAYYHEHALVVIFSYRLIYILSTAVSLPGAVILTLAGGAVFGVLIGTVLVSVASTIGATLAFLASRFLFRDFVMARFGDSLKLINEGMERDGNAYLFSLRLIPIFPFFLINLVMGLSKISVSRFFLVSQIGMLPATILYVNAGTQLANISSVKGIFTFKLLLSFALIGILPLCFRWILARRKYRKKMARFKRPKHFDYNMVVIGGGSAGLVSAYIAAAVKAKVALVEKHKMGGDCLNTGCVPSKALIRSAKVYNYFRRAKEFGLDSLPAQVNFIQVMNRVKDIIQEISPHDSVDRYSKLGVDCFQGSAYIRSPFEVEVNGKILTTKNIVVATGARPFVPSIPGLSECLTSDTVWNLKTLPKRLVVLGGGPIGCELAQSFSRFGSSVSIVEMGSRLLAKEDADISALIEKRFSEEGIELRTGHKAVRVENKTLVCEKAGKEISVPFDEILIALGRKANAKGFGLEELGVEISAQGTLPADDFMRTNFSNIFVCGDITGPFQFTHTASYQAWFVAVNALFGAFKKFRISYRVIPWCTFSDPEVARVGLNETEAKVAGIPYEVTQYEFSELDRAIADSETSGFVKVLTVPGKDKILGATIVGSHAGDIIAEYVTAMKFGLGLNKILSTIHIYPTLAEANKYAAGAWKRTHSPSWALAFLEKYHAWQRRS